ncbi:MAG: zinc-ribbon domain-containing protein, partial [Candidatus Babeliales bacterium]
MNKQSKKPSFLETHSHIAKQWHPTKNGDLNPGKVVANINLNVWWLCPVSNDHEWKNTIAYRAKANSTCPFCLNYRLSKTNNLLALHPVLSERWHYKKNYPLTAKDVVGTGSKKVYWWRCNIDHEWKASIISHIRKDGSYRSCPKCHKAPLSVTHPNILTEWHPTKNGKLTPDDVRGGSACYLWWKCSKGPDHEWKQKAIERTRSGSGCPFCDGKKVSLTNSLLTKYPDLAKEWHPTKNGKLLTQNVFGGGKAKYWWKCSKGTDHEWQANIQKRASGQGCPICRGLKIVLSNSLFLTHPNIVKEWHVTKNSITPNDVMAGSGKKVWWQCVKVKSHEWETTIKIRAKGGHGCPFCNSGWTIEKIRLFIVSLLPYLHTLDEAELYVLIQQNGLLDISRSSKSKSFIEALKTGKFPQEELEKFVKSELSLVDAFIDDSSMTLNEYQQNLMASENVINEDDIQEAKMFSDAETKDILSSLDSPIYANLDKEAAEFFVNSAVAKIWRHAFRDEQRDEDVVEYQLAAYTGDGLYANEV